MVSTEAELPLLQLKDSLAKGAKMTEDFSQEVDDALRRAPGLALHEATAELFCIEKKARQANDSTSCIKIATYLMDRHKDENNWTDLNSMVSLLWKKRGQMKQVVIHIVQKMMLWIEEAPTPEIRSAVIKVLRVITEDKIFLEAEKARLIRLEAQDFEKDGNIEEAAKLIQKIQIETCGSMDIHERTEYILHQFRLVLAIKDLVRCQIISRKLNTKILEQPDFQDFKIQYYQYMTECYLLEKDYLSVAKMQYHIFNTPKILEADTWMNYLEDHVLYLIMAYHPEEPVALLRKLVKEHEKHLVQMPTVKTLVDLILSTEIVSWEKACPDLIQKCTLFKREPSFVDIFRKGFLCHNTLVIAQYYSRIKLARGAELLQITEDEFEKMLAEVITKDIIYARIARPDGEVRFGKPMTAQARLDSWSESLDKLLTTLRETSHLIDNESMIQAALKKRAEANKKS